MKIEVVENKVVVTIDGTAQADKLAPLIAYPYATILSPMPAWAFAAI